jgi:hypothetical protein
MESARGGAKSHTQERNDSKTATITQMRDNRFANLGIHLVLT